MSIVDPKPCFWRFLDERNLWPKIGTFLSFFFHFGSGMGSALLSPDEVRFLFDNLRSRLGAARFAKTP